MEGSVALPEGENDDTVGAELPHFGLGGRRRDGLKGWSGAESAEEERERERESSRIADRGRR